MRISTLLSYASGFKEAVKEVQALEKAGLDVVWVPEAYSFDAPSAMGSLSKAPAKALASLPDGYRSAVTMVDIGGMSYREAALRLDVPVGTIMSRLHRGRKLLAAQLDGAPAETRLPRAA